MEVILLIGVFILVIGFALKIDPIAVVLISALTTALVGGSSFIEAVEMLGTEFVNSRYLTMFFLTLPVIGISERYGLKEQATKLIQKSNKVTTSKILTTYLVLRQIAGAMSLRLGGHPQFVRPLVEPMAQGAASKDLGEDHEFIDEVKSASAAAENYGNFFGQNLFYAASGVLLVASTLKDYNVEASKIVIYGIPIAICALIIAVIQFSLLERKIERKKKSKKGVDQ